MSDAPTARPPPRRPVGPGPEVRRARGERYALAQQRGRARRAAAHRRARVPRRRPRRARHDRASNPLTTYRAIFNGTGPRTGSSTSGRTSVARTRDRSAALNLQQTLIVTTPLDPHRARRRVRVPLRHVQHRRPGPVHRRRRSSRSGSARRSTGLNPARCTSCSRSSLGDARRRGAGPGSPGFLKATVGAHEVISTIMLNWIAIWVGELPVRPRRPAPERHRRRRSRSRTTSSRARSCRSSGATRSCRASTSASSSRSARSSSTGSILNRTTLGYEVRAVGFNPEAARYGGISVARNYFLAMAISGAFAGLAGALDILGWQFRLATSDIQASHDRLHRHRGRAARPEHRGRRRPRRRCSSARSLTGTSTRQPRPRGLPARARRRT